MLLMLNLLLKMTTNIRIKTNKFVGVLEVFKTFKGYCIFEYDVDSQYSPINFALFNDFKELLDFIDDDHKKVGHGNHVIERCNEKCKITYNQSQRTLIIEYGYDSSDTYTKYMLTNIYKEEYKIIESMIEKKLSDDIDYTKLIEN